MVVPLGRPVLQKWSRCTALTQVGFLARLIWKLNRQDRGGFSELDVLLKMGNFCAVWLELPSVGAAPHC